MSAVGQVLDVLQPRRFLHDLAAGSVVLVRLIMRGLLAALRAASHNATAPAKTEPVYKDGQEEQPASGTKTRAATAVRSGTDRVEQIAMGALVVLVCAGAVGTFGGVVLVWLRPYLPLIAGVAVVGWIVAALVAAPGPQQSNDHETSAGEQQPEGEPEEDPWPAQREAIRRFVDQAVAAGAAGHAEAKGRGARVDDLLTALQERGAVPDFDRAAMTELLERCGITVREQMKFRVGGKQKNTPGVHIEDLARDLGHAPRLPAHLVPDLTPTSSASGAAAQR
ncbi:hypothetical protein [Streptomyces sp. NPDC058891]|uniref:hypothetical protein n=1 Tax=Streptomyces sp. NPDC058891 TaxID=3346667 RepID=UPI0036BADEA6